MPKSVRNFYLQGAIDGKKSPLKAGTRSKDGGFTLTIKQRVNGGIKDVATITGRVSACKKNLGLEVQVGENVLKCWTPR